MDKKYRPAESQRSERASIDRSSERELSCIDDSSERRGKKSVSGKNRFSTAGSSVTEGSEAPRAHSHRKTVAANISTRRTQTKELVALYDLDGIRAALGMPPKPSVSYEDEAFYTDLPPGDTEHQTRLGAILTQGDKGRWRYAVGPDEGFEDALAKLSARAPHLGELSDLVRMNMRAATNLGAPIFLTPVLLVGPPGMGKTWFLARLAAALRIPFRSYSMSTSTLGEGLQGAHPSWRNAGPGLVAKTLLREMECNPVIVVDEFDKVSAGTWNSDPYRPFYQLLDPAGSSAFVDEYLGFEIDASRVLWVMAANDCTLIPPPILDRLVVLHVPEMTLEQKMAVVSSVYADANAARRGYFDAELSPQVVQVFASMTPRSMRIALDEAMSRAAAEARRAVSERDVRFRQTTGKWKAGFR